ncbi:MAG: hypothetical protein Q8R24_04890 [Legionellaceae bacterium]|nr:hypothetical protein [Legionellaceae bacterium]
MPTSSGTTVGTSQAPLPTLPRSPRIATHIRSWFVQTPEYVSIPTISATLNNPSG